MMTKRLMPFALLFLPLVATSCQRSSPISTASASTTVPPPVVAPPGGTVVAPLAAPVGLVGSGDVASLVERLKPTVVNITTTSRASAGPTDSEGSFGFPLPFFSPPPRGRRAARALGTGFIVDPAGFVVTNSHVIQGADDIKVRLSDERELPAKLVGKDPKLDLALLRIEGAAGLSAVAFGDSNSLRVGDWVIAIGNPFGLGHTVTLGITSAKDRTIGAGPYDAFIQTDASINPGNSGGPLFNLRGEVVGIPTAIRQGAQGIGFAVPVNALKDVLPQLRDKGSVTRGKLGVRFQPITDELAQGLGLDRARGALVAEVEAASSGARAGLVAGDIITAVNGTDVLHAEELPRLVARNAPGTRIKLGVMRNGKLVELTAILDTLVDNDEDEEGGGGRAPSTPVPAPKGKLGVVLEDANGGGARIRAVAPQSPVAGQLTAGDVVLEADRKPVRNAAEFAKIVDTAAAGKMLLLRVKRGPMTQYVAVKLN